MDLQDVGKGLERVENRLVELVAQGAVHNTLLQTHEARSLALQQGQEKLDERIKPIETHVKLLGGGLKIAGLIAVGVCVQWAVRRFL